MKILLAEDEKDLSRALCAVLKMSKYDVDAVYDGEEALEHSLSNSYDAMIFDVMMPRMDGITAVKKIRATGNVTPILFLTAKSELDDKVEGFNAGGDDYLTKPFAMKELLARVKSMTRRVNEYTPKTIKVGTVTLNTEEQEMVSENSIRLAGKESKLMTYFMLNNNRKISEDEIFDRIWGDENGVEKCIVLMYITYLNNKLKSINADIFIEKDDDNFYTLKQIEG